jgi:hypothetical protein
VSVVTGSLRVMDEQHLDEQTPHPVGDGVTDRGAGDRATGVGEVDAVLASLDGLAERPVSEHVAVFEQAHERLRRALDAPAG